MAFVKAQKTRNYFMRYQVKYRRRRDCKTDYYARQRLIVQDKNKYTTPKYRFVVRITNYDIIAQIVYSKIVGDVVVCAAYAHELPRFGLKAGLTNYSAAYCTGLLCARRLLNKLNIESKFEGRTEINADDFEYESGPRPFTAFLDVGLRRTTTGSRIFAVVKGACDGGVNVPHSNRRYVGFDSEKGELNLETFKKHITGKHVVEYMKKMKGDDEEKYQKHFSQFIKNGLTPENLEKTIKSTMAAIRKNPAAVKKEHKKPTEIKTRPKRIGRVGRRANAQAKLAAAASQ